MSNISRDTTAGRVFNDLRNKAKREGRNTQELLILYTLERFLYRLAQSEYRDQFLLKGGLLLATLDARRPTKDGDLLTYMDCDMWRLTRQHDIDGDSLIAAINRTAEHRGVHIRELSISVGDLVEQRASAYRTWRNRQDAEADAYPEAFGDIVSDVITYADPALSGNARAHAKDDKSL